MKNISQFCFFPLVLILLGRGLYSKEDTRGAIEVRIPTYDQSGRLNWELEAAEVDIVEEGIYSAKNPKMFILENRKLTTIAKSNAGLFNISEGMANGSGNLFVEGDGFEAIGRPWSFVEDTNEGISRLAFSEQGKIGFEDKPDANFFASGGKEITGSRVSGVRPVLGNSLEKAPDFSKDFPTTAHAKKIVLDDLGGGERRFVLKQEVLIEIVDSESNSSETETSTIVCDRAEILLGKEGNGRELDTLGKISQIHAAGNVQFLQPLRKSSADELKWTEESGRVDLLGNAKVFHQKWGEAQGEKISISEKDGRAEVVGGNQGRSKLLLPALNKTRIP